MNISLKRILSFVLAFVLVVGMLPANALSVWAADGVWQIDDKTTTPTKAEPTGDKVAHSVWVLDKGTTLNPNPERVCVYSSEHTHGNDCFYWCDHAQNGNDHLTSCYTNPQWGICNHGDSCSATTRHEFSLSGGLSAINAALKDTSFKTYLQNTYGTTKAYQLLGKVAGNAYCLSGELICDHKNGPGVHTDDCCNKTEHTHVETLEKSCWEYHWTLKADVNGNGEADDTETKYTIKYVGVNGTVLQETKSVADVKTPAYTGATPVREFYTFKDWGTVADKVTGDATYVATWTPIKDEDGDGIADEEDNFVISWDNGAGTWADGSADAVKTETKNYGESLTAPGVVAPVDHVFSGWSPEVDKVTKTVTYVAQYTKDSIYTITYKVDGNTYVVDGKEQVFYVNATDGEIVPSVADPSKDGYVFTGWSNDGVIGTVPTADVTLEAQWADDANRNGVADGNETAQVTLTVGEGGTATLTNGGNDKIIITNNGNVYIVVYDSTTAGGDKVVVSTTVNGKPATNQAYYLKQIDGATEGKVEVKDEDDKTVTVTFGLEVFTLPDAPQGGYVIEVNGFDNSSMANGLKSFVLDAILGKGNYHINDYKVEMWNAYTVDLGALGSYDLGERYYNVDGETIEFNFFGERSIDLPASWFVTQLKVDNSTLNNFKITKLAASNASKTDLYIENVMIKAKEVREKTEDITLGKTDYTADTLDKLIADIKNNVLVNGAEANVTVTLAPAEQQLGTNKQTWTATITAPATADYLESSKEFTITATINSYSIKWDVDGVVTEQKLPFGTAITTPAAPSKEGHTFAGWKGWTEGATAKNDVTYTAEWTINTYTVTWTVNGETFTTTDVEYGEAITAPEYTTPEGHTFHGWQNIPATMPAGNITLDASLTVNQYKITWVVEGVETSEDYTYNELVEKENPVKEGWGFVGWYDEAGNRVDLATFKMPVAENGIKLTAKFFQAAAMIGETPYQSFDEAMAAAKDGDTVLLLKDATIDKKYVINGNVTISGQFTITRADSYTGTLFEVKSGATLTLDGNLTIDGGNHWVMDKNAYNNDLYAMVQVPKAECEKYFTLIEGEPIVGSDHMINVDAGNLNLGKVTIKNHYSRGGQLVNAVNGAQITLDGAQISHCANVNNGGLLVGISGAGSKVTMNDGTVVDGNHVGGNHGVFRIYTGALFVMNGGEIKNTTGWNSNGSAIGVYIAEFIMNGGTICNNSSVWGDNNQRNPAVYIHSNAKMTMNGGTICHNIGKDYAGGIASYKTNSTIIINGGSVVNNVSLNNDNRGDIFVERGDDVDTPGVAQISGGTFTQDVNNWAVDGYKAEEIEPGVWGVREKEEFTVTFEGIDGSVTVTEDDCVAVPGTAPTKDQAIFGGWDFDFTTPITGSITINAKWISDLNRNNVPDDNEKVTVKITGNGTVEAGLQPYGDGYIFDSTKATVEVVVTPVVNDGISASYVASINGAALTYGEGFVATANLTVANGDVIEIVLVDVPQINGDKVVVDYNFFTKVIPYGDIYNAVISTPAYKNDAVKYTYFARPAMKHTVSIDSLDLDSSIKTLLNTIGIKEFSFDMEELWLPLDAQIQESVDLETAVSTYLTKERINGLLDIYNAAHDAAYGPAYDKAYQEYVDRLGTTFGADTVAKGAAEAAAIAAGGKAVKDDIQVIYDVVYASAKYYGAHNFGYNATGADTVDELIRIEYTDESMHWTTDATVTLKDPRESAFISGSDQTLIYRDYTDEELLAMFGLVDANGNPIEGAVYSVQLSDPYTFEGKNVSETVYELTVKFAGNEDYRAAEKTFNITIVKATASIDVPNVNATFGDLLPGIDVTMGNKYGDKQEIIDSLVQIIIGLDLDELEITPDGKLEGIGTRIQIMLPKDDTLATIFKTLGLDVYGEEGVTLSLGELQGYLDQLDGLLGSFDSGSEMVDGITNILESVTGLVDLSNVEITFGGKYPTDMGVYVYGVVSTSGNYETAYDVGYIVIKPDTTKVYLDWNKPITNSVLNLEALKNFDLGATAFDDELFANLNAEATKLIINLYLGIDLNGKTYLTADPTSLGNGAYIEIAFIYDIGNEMYYAVPIVRPVVVAPDMVDVELKDQYGNTTNDMVVDFNNKGQSFDIFINGELANDNDFLTVYYIGVQSNGQFYHSTEKPVHAGVYTAIAVYAEYMNEDGELTIMNIEDIINGIIDGLDIESIDIDQILATLQSDLDGLESFGINAGVITILPVESNVTVEDKVEIVEPNKQNRPVDQVIVGSSADANLRPDSTIISAGIASNGTFTENGWSAVYGNVNIDFPAWVDAILAEYVPGIADGITVAELSDMLSAKLPAILAVLEEKGASNEVLNSLTNAINNVLKVLNEIPGNTTLTFESDIAYTNVGAYVIVAIVTDSDHIPSIDAGFLVIRPNVTNVELEWNYEDDNNLFTRDLLEAIDYDLWAKALANGVFDKYATAKITYQFIGVNADGEFVIYTDPTSMPNGAYIQLAYIAFELDGQMYISDMIARPVVIAPSSCKVEVDELHTEFDNTNKDVTVTITDLEGNVIDITKGELTFVYAGLQANGQPYLSATAPKHAGVYEVIVVYVEYDENGAMRYYGAGVGALVIDLTDSTIDVTGGNEEYNGNGYTATVIPGSTVSDLKPDFTLISGGVWYVGDINAVGLSDLRGNVNIDFPKWFDAVIAEYEFADGINPAYLTRFINAYRADMIAQVEEAVDKLGANVTVDQLNAYIDELLTVLAQLPSDAALSFNDNMSYSEVGYYFYYGIITDSDHKPSTDTGVLVIEPTDISDIEATDTVYNGYEQTTTLTVIGANGAVLTEGIDFVIVSGNKATNAGTYTVTIQGIGNYTGEYTVEWTIEKAKVTVTVNDATKVYGENDPIFSAVISGLKINDTLNVSFQRVEGENVGEYVISAYASDDNYDITFVTGKLTITKASVVVDVNDATKVYGSADPAFSALVSGLKFNDQLNITFTREEGENVGKYVITASASDANYDITFVSGVLTITKANITINVEDAEKVYGSADPTFTATVNGLQFNDKLNIEFSRETGENVGQYIIKASAEDANYNITVVFGTLSITKANITINVEDAEKIYGSADPAFSALVSGLKFNDQLNITFTREEGENVGKYVITASASDANYDITFVSGVLTITKANITINVEDAEKVYGSTDPTFTATVNGLQFNDKLNIEFSRETGENVGQYIIKASAEDANYNITVVFGTLTITKASVVVDVNDATKVYGSADPAFSALVSGLKFNDVLNITFTREPGENVGEYVISATASNANYNITVVDGTFTITAKQITDADVALNGGLVYNGNEQGHNVVLLNGITADLSGELTGKNAGKYILTVTGTGNYAGSVEMEWAIAKKAATIAANNLSMVAGNIVPGFTAVVEGVVDGETLNYTMSCVADGKNAGIYDIILTLGENSNYDVTVINGKLTVKEAIAKNTVTGVYYAKLQDAIDAVKNGETIVMLTDIDEDVTIKQTAGLSFTIDGDGHQYTGTMTINGNKISGDQGQALTIKNVNFVGVQGQASIETVKSSFARNITVENCSFTGMTYGMILRHAYSVSLKDVTASNLGELVYTNKAVTGFTAENVKVTDADHGFYMTYAYNASFKNVELDVTGYGIYLTNNTQASASFEDCNIKAETPIYLKQNNEVKPYELTINGANTMVSTNDSAWLVVEGTDANFKVVMNDTGLDMTKTEGLVARIGNVYYNTLKYAIEDAKDNDTIVVLDNIDIADIKPVTLDGAYNTYFLVEGKTITVDLNGKTISGEYALDTMLVGVFSTDNGGHLTLTGNGTVDITSTEEATVYALLVAYESGTSLTIENGIYKLDKAKDCLIYSGGHDCVTVNDGYYYLGNVGDGTNGKPWIFNVLGQNDGHTNVNGGTFNADIDDRSYQHWIYEVSIPEDKCCVDNGDGTWTVMPHPGNSMPVIVIESKATCTTDGIMHIIVHCTECGHETSRTTIVTSATGHSYTAVVTAPTCTEGGYTTYTCDCGHSYVADYTEATGHVGGTPTYVFASQATCTTNGIMYVITNCTECGHEISHDTIVTPAKGHIAGAPVQENNVAPTVDAEGSYDMVTYCTVCDEELERVHHTVAKLEPVAKNTATGKLYATLAAAIKAANAGDTIVLLANVTEDVTVSKSITIDGDNWQYTGNIAVEGGNAVVTIKNVNFVDGTGYAIKTDSIKSITVENCTVKNYGYGFLYANKSTPTVVVKDVTVDGATLGFNWVYGTTATLENVVMTNVTYGLQIHNYASKTVNLKNCDITSIVVYERTDNAGVPYTGVQTFNFYGDNTVDTLTDSQYAKYVLVEENATLTAPADFAVTTTVADSVVKYVDGTKYVVAKILVKNENTGATYTTLADAIAEATAGDKLVFLGDITEDVTVNKSLTIDGANFKYTGTMTVTGNTVAATIKNVNFVDGTGYAIKTNTIKSITVENCTVKNYGYGFLYANKSTSTIVVKNVTVEGGNYGLFWNYGNTATLENVTVTGTESGILISNYGSKTINLKNCTIDAINVNEKTSNNVTFKFYGDNTVDTLTDSQYAKYVLANKDATLTAPAGFTVTVNDKDYKVAYENGAYFAVAKNYVAQIGETKFESIAEAIAAANNGDTIVILKDHEIDSTKIVNETTYGYSSLLCVEGKQITIDFNGHNVEVTPDSSDMLIAVVFVGKGGNLALKNSTGNGGFEVNDGTDLYCLIYNSKSTVTIENGRYHVEETVVSGSLIYADKQNDTTINGGYFTLVNAAEDANSTKPWIFNVHGKNEGNFVKVNGGTFNQNILMNKGTGKDCEVNLKDGYCLHLNVGNGTWTVKAHVAGEAVREDHTAPTFNQAGCYDMVTYCQNCGEELKREHFEIPVLGAVAQNINTGVYYTDVSDALMAAVSGETVILLVDGQTEAMLMVPNGVTFNLNGHTVTAGNVFSFGNVIDNNGTTDGLGGIKISNDRTKAFVQLQQTNTYLPLYDAANGCYRFFYYELSVLTYQVKIENTVTFRARLRLSSAEAYKLLADTANSGVELSVQMEIKGSTKTSYVNYVLTGEFLAEYAQGAYNQVVNGEKTPMKMNKTLDLTLTGLGSVESGTVLTIVPTVTSETGVSFEKNVINDQYTVYIIP